MDELISWLRQQLDADVQQATHDLWMVERASNQGDWTAHYGYNLPFSELRAGNELIGKLTAHIDGLPDGGEDQHAADALLVVRLVRSAKARVARVLREVEVKRQILDHHAPVVDGSQGSWAWFEGSESASRRLLCLMALPYSDRPGYREEAWKP